MTQEAVAEQLGVSRQTISKWELDETLPDIRQAKGLSKLYGVTLDDLIDYDAEVQEIQRVIEHTSQEVQDKIDWTKLWGQKYPILLSAGSGHPSLFCSSSGSFARVERHLSLLGTGCFSGAQGYPGQALEPEIKMTHIKKFPGFHQGTFSLWKTMKGSVLTE